MVGDESHLVGHAGREGVGTLICHHLTNAIEAQFLFYIVHLVEVKVKGPVLAKSVKFVFVERDGDDLVGSGFSFDHRKSFVVDECTVSSVLPSNAIHSTAVAAQHKA